MARSLNPTEIATILGTEAPKRVEPGNRAEVTMEATKALDDRLDHHVDSNRLPGETFEAAHSRILGESPALYGAYKLEKAKILRGHGFGNASTGGV